MHKVTYKVALLLTIVYFYDIFKIPQGDNLYVSRRKNKKIKN